MAKVHLLAGQLVSLKRKFDDMTWEVQNLEKQLAMADAYGCLEPHVLYGVQPDGDITEEDVQYGIHQVTDPWEQGPNYENATCE
jgi:hypothetical protein